MASMCERWKEKGGSAYGIGKSQEPERTELHAHAIVKGANGNIILQLSAIRPTSVPFGITISNVSGDANPSILSLNTPSLQSDDSLEAKAPFDLVTNLPQDHMPAPSIPEEVAKRQLGFD